MDALWSKYGTVIGRYRMKLGTDVMRLYHENGRLKLEKHYVDNLEEGPTENFTIQARSGH